MPIDTPEAIRQRVPPSSAGQWLPLRPGIEIPGRHFDRGLRHVVAANRPQGIEDVARMLEGRAEQTRREKSGDDVPGGFGRFAAVVRIGFGDRLAPALVPVAFERARAETSDRSCGQSWFRKS